MKIAVLLTCHNRAEKTGHCMSSLVNSLKTYNDNSGEKERIDIEVYLVDDRCTDNTVDVVYQSIKGFAPIHILNGDGNLFWAGGMRFCWKEALKRHDEWDFYLLLNDDVVLTSNAFTELLTAHQYALRNYQVEGIYSGITCDPDDNEKMTYGGDVWINRLLAKSKRLQPTGSPQICDVTNANILMVSKTVVDKIGIFYEGYIHGSADQDYSWMARKKGIPVLLTSHFCGTCPMDHKGEEGLREMILGMNFKQRKEYFTHPLHSSKEQIISEWRMSPLRAPITLMGRFLILYFPKTYYWINGLFR